MATRSDDDSLQRLRAAISDLAAGDAPEVVAEARAEARARVRSLLSDAMSRSLLDSVEDELTLPALEDPVQETGPSPSPGDEVSSLSNEDGAWYVYGVVGSLELDHELTGVDGAHQVSTLREGSLAAVVSRVPAAEFDDSRLRANLGDMAWVEKLARAHEAVLDATRQKATVVPMRMCTVYRTEGGVREMLGREGEALREALEHLERKAEWGVKAFSDPSAVSTRDDDTADLPPASGAAYMDRRRRDLERKELSAGRVQEAALQIHERLCELAVDGLVAPPQRPEASGHPDEMVLNGVYLVEDDAHEAFEEEVSCLQEEFASLGLTLVLTGPWPAYNFVPGTIGAAW